MSTIRVKARAGIQVPHEHNARRYITADAVAEVPATAYYLRRIGEGDLVRTTTTTKKEPVKNG